MLSPHTEVCTLLYIQDQDIESLDIGRASGAGRRALVRAVAVLRAGSAVGEGGGAIRRTEGSRRALNAGTS